MYTPKNRIVRTLHRAIACRLLLATTILCIAPIAAALPQTPPNALPPGDPSLPSADTLIAQAVEGLGGTAKLALIRSYRAEAEAQLEVPANALDPARTLHAKGEILWHRDGHARMRSTCDTIDMQSQTVWPRALESGVKPDFNWSRLPDREREIFGRLPGTIDTTAHADPLRILYDGLARHTETLSDARTVRQVRIHGKDCYQIAAHLRYRPTDAARNVTLWLDVSQKRLVQASDGARVRYDDWRDIGVGPDDPLGGVLAPFRITAGNFCGDHLNGFRELATITLIRFNSVVPDDIVAPSGLRDMSEIVAEEMARSQQPSP